jgi:hypothetical protein
MKSGDLLVARLHIGNHEADSRHRRAVSGHAAALPSPAIKVRRLIIQ